MTPDNLFHQLRSKRILASIGVLFLVVGLGVVYVQANGMTRWDLIQSVKNVLTKQESNELAQELNDYRDPTSSLERSLVQESTGENVEDPAQAVFETVGQDNNEGENDGEKNTSTNDTETQDEESASSASPTPEPSTTVEDEDLVSSPTLTPTPTSTDEPTPTQEPTPTPDVATLTKVVELLSGSSATPEANGELEMEVVQNKNGYWDFYITGTFENLQPEREYQIWLCNANCSSHKSARFSTDSDGNGTITGAEVTHSQLSDPVAMVKIWEITDTDVIEDENTACHQEGNDSVSCLQGDVSW